MDIERKARLELACWIVHRELAGTAAVLYPLPAGPLPADARLRAAAMAIPDAGSPEEGASKAHQRHIVMSLVEGRLPRWQARKRFEIG